tara:strand:+ start:315 stop:524 length:210 start_codon:yes stop_codon:yes gene_type:complete
MKKCYAVSIRPNGIEYLKVHRITDKSFVGYVVKKAVDGKILSLPRQRRVARSNSCVIVDRKFIVNQLGD